MNNITFVVREEDMNEFRYYLQERENSEATIEKYMRDVRKFMTFAGTDQPVGKEKLLEYKEWLIENYAVSSVNSMLVALNQFLVFLEKGRLRLRRIKVQRMDTLCMDRILDKREFQKLVRTARQQGKDQIAMIMETMCATGIRVSELKFFHVENVRNGIVRVWNKGKYRMVILPELLRKKLLLYIGRNRFFFPELPDLILRFDISSSLRYNKVGLILWIPALRFPARRRDPCLFLRYCLKLCNLKNLAFLLP